MPSARFIAQCLFLLLPICGQVAAADRPQIRTLTTSLLAEASGLAIDADGQRWLINDSGNPARLLRLPPDGRQPEPVALPMLRNRDWESLSLMHRNGQAWLVIADVGDNRAKRDAVQLHFLALSRGTSPVWRHSLELTYPDGARDCEAVAYDPLDDRLWLLSKRDQPPQLYSLPASAALQESRMRVEPAGELGALPKPLHLPGRDYRRLSFAPTGMDIRADGRLIVLLNYVEAYAFPRHGRESIATALRRRPLRLGLPLLPQAEAIALNPAGDAVEVVSEQLPTRLASLPLPPDLWPESALGDNRPTSREVNR